MLPRVFVAALLVVGATAQISWCYDETPGCAVPANVWNLTWPECGMPFNSPINLRGSQTVGHNNNNMPDIEFYYQNNTATTLITAVNDGHAVVLRNFARGQNYMKEGPLTEAYSLNHIRIHVGSEHLMNGNRKRAELQFVHARSTPHTADVTTEYKGLAVLSVLVNRGKHNIEMQKIIDEMNRTVGGIDYSAPQNPELSIPVRNFSIAGILPKQYYSKYYSYQGSLTIPPCTQSVTWMVAKNYITMSSDQLYFFKGIVTNMYGQSGNNYRPEQPLMSRMIARSYGKTGRGGNNGNGILGLGAGAAHGGGHGGHLGR